MCTKEMTLGEEIINLSAKGVDISTVERIYKKYINQCKSEDITVGDQIKIPLEDLGTFTATVHNITDDKILFIFDDYVARRRINNKNVNKGGYGESDLKEWIDMKLFNKFPLEFRKNMSDLTIPTVGQILGWDDEWCRSTFEYDDNEQFLSMKSREIIVQLGENQEKVNIPDPITQQEFRNYLLNTFDQSPFADILFLKDDQENSQSSNSFVTGSYFDIAFDDNNSLYSKENTTRDLINQYNSVYLKDKNIN